MVSADELRKALSFFATGVTVVATLEKGGKAHGMTANAVTSVSLDPPLVLVCVGHQRNTYRYIRQTGQFAINILERSQDEVAKYFALQEDERTGETPATFESSRRGTPRLQGAIGFIDCEVVGTHDYGDHTIFVGAVQDTSTQPGEPLLFYQSRLTQLGEA